MKYIIYTRQSKPAKKTQVILLSHETQQQKCLELVPEGAEKLIITDPSSADNNVLRRKKFVKALEDIQRGDVFIVYKLDRLSRDFYQMGYIKTTIEIKGATLISATEKDIDRTMMGFHAVMSDHQKRDIGKHTKEVLHTLKFLGYRVGRIPYGYCLREDRKVVVNPPEMEILQLIEKYRAQGKCFRSIENELRLLNVRNRRGAYFSYVAIHQILKNAHNHRAAYQPQLSH